jgi:hypothetical protein
MHEMQVLFPFVPQKYNKQIWKLAKVPSVYLFYVYGSARQTLLDKPEEFMFFVDTAALFSKK